MSNNSRIDNLKRQVKRLEAELKQSQGRQQELLTHKQQIDASEDYLLGLDDKTSSCMRNLRMAGVEISLDSFAFSHSSVSHIRNFNIDYLKIDSGLISDLSSDTNSFELCVKLINLAHKKWDQSRYQRYRNRKATRYIDFDRLRLWSGLLVQPTGTGAGI